MNITIKPNSYYKLYYYGYPNSYSLCHTNTTQMYKIAQKTGTYKPSIKLNKKLKWGSIKEWEMYITRRNDKIEEISKEDVFLELL